MPCGWRRRKSRRRLSLAVLCRRDHIPHHHRGADHSPARRVRPRQGSQGMTAAADIIRAPGSRTSWSLGAALLGLCFLLACAAPLGVNGYGLYLLTLTEIFALVALGLNFLTGYAGQISLCHAAFFGVGAYATALLTQKAGVPYLLSLVAGALFTTAIGALVALPALRLKNIYLAIATLGFGVVLQTIIF